MVTRTSGTVTKAIDILDLFLTDAGGLTNTGISNATGFNKSTVVRLCATLEKRGYLRRDTHGVYFVGKQIDKLSHIFRSQYDLEEVIRPIIQNLRDKTGESASYYVIDGDARLCLYRENSFHTIRHVVEEGTRLPFKDGAVGPVLMAFSGTSGSEMNKIRKNGFLDSQGREPYTASVAVPVLENSENLVGSLVVSGLADRFDEAKRTRALKLLLNASAKLVDMFPSKDMPSG